VFDTIYGTYGIKVVVAAFFTYFWLNFGIFLLTKIALAQVEEGYMTGKLQ